MLLVPPVDAYSTDDAELASLRAASQSSTLPGLLLHATVMQVELKYQAQASKQTRRIVCPIAFETAVRLRTLTLDNFHTTLPDEDPHPGLPTSPSRSQSNSSDHSKNVLPSAPLLLQVDDDNGRMLTTTSLLLPQRQTLIPSVNVPAQGGPQGRHFLGKRRSQGWLVSNASPVKDTAVMHARDGLHSANVPNMDADMLQRWFRSDVASLLHSALDCASLVAAVQLSAAKMGSLGALVQGLALNFTYDHGEPVDDVCLTHQSTPCSLRFWASRDSTNSSFL
jgi:hypothetical protein